MYRANRTFKILTVFFSVVYFIFLIYAVFFARRRHHLNVRYLNIVPLRNSLRDYHNLAAIGIFNFLSNTLGNVFVFMPIPFILTIFLKITRFSTVLLIGFLLSFSIELLQYIFDVGVADIDDLILNTFGTALGYCCLKLFNKWTPGFFQSII